MNFRTIVDLSKYDFEINHRHNCIFIGSCFSENIGEKLKNTKIETLVNPTGIHYNPLSIANTLEIIMESSFVKEEDLFFSNGIWNNYNFHSKFSHTSKEETIEKINTSITAASNLLKQADYLFITFGTSYIYLLNETEKVVSNCHKQSSNKFRRDFLKSKDTFNLWDNLIQKLFSLNNKLKIIFTVSPIRHWKHGATNNAYSKSSLLIAIKELLETTRYNNHLYYFPAFEIVNDELRDYRFYADDMLHPSSMAIEYIWERFNDAFFSQHTKEINKKIRKIYLAANHKPFNSNTKEYKDFCNNMLNEINEIEIEYPYINITEEKEKFENIINNA